MTRSPLLPFIRMHPTRSRHITYIINFFFLNSFLLAMKGDLAAATLKHRTMSRIIKFLIVISSVSAFVPRQEQRLGQSTNSIISTTTTTKIGVSASYTPTKQKVKKNNKPWESKKNNNLKQFQWLNWVYCQWRDKEPGELDENLLKQMSPAILGWGRRKTHEGADRAEELLQRIIDENLAGNKKAELTVTLFNSAMDAHAKVGNPDGVQRILKKMLDLRKGHENMGHLQPDVFSMSTLATAWTKSRSPESSKKAEAILEYMRLRNMPPNTVTYNAVLNAMANGKEIDKAIRIEDLIKRMKERSKKGEDCEPDIYSYQSLIQAWSKTPLSGSPQKAEEVLLFLDNEFEKGKTHLKPNYYCFTSTVHAWAKSHERQRAKKAYQIFTHMKKRYIESKSKMLKPTVVIYTAVLNACAWPEDESEKEDAFEIAKLTMDELSLGTYGEPNFLSFAAFLCVCCSTLEPGQERDEIVRKTFNECIAMGQVGALVLEKLNIAASAELYHELLDKNRDQNGNLIIPSNWKKNVKGERGVVTDQYSHSKGTTIKRSSMARLKQIEEFRGKSGAYSGASERIPEFEGISWSSRGFEESANDI